MNEYYLNLPGYGTSILAQVFFGYIVVCLGIWDKAIGK